MPDMNRSAIIAEPPPRPTVPGASPAEVDRWLHAWENRFTLGRSPSTVALAYLDWAAHAANAPFQTAELARSAVGQWRRLLRIALGQEDKVAPPASDHRFAAPAWQQHPFDLLTQAVLLGEAWWNDVVDNPAGVNPRHRRIVRFTVRQWLDMVSPSNVPWLNPEVIEAAQASNGRNFVDGLINLLHDQSGTTRGDFAAGRNLAVTPGKVVFRNALIELIQYAPATATVAPEPVLIVPAWIMKYYILDLSPGNSMIRWLVAQGYTVFAISWRNPTEAMHNTSLDDYRAKGVMAALDAIRAICGEAKVHATGYCLGGTLTAITAATMARDGDDRLASLSLFAAQTDFTEAGELQLFITEDQLSFLADVTETQGFLSSAQMGSAFQMLQSNELVWSRAVRRYLLGQREHPFDLMAWNVDGTRLPARMHIEYLRRLYLRNELAEGRFEVDGRPLALEDIHLPIFLVGTEQDHIAPWRSVYKLHLFTAAELTFALASGGHNAGIVSEPGHPHRHFRLRTDSGRHTLGPDEWLAATRPQDGSWWTAWADWLKKRSSAPAEPPPMGAPGYLPLCDAPGTYVLED
ncbi:PHA/PHB synthase family protein [Rhodopila globiformis]|uniref:Poly-beta-hydroxybutyrate polymerase n=1 Tax=Rhodopila globiformis TaxID=1071 RepID=A0A2S6NLJ2_RHOGL|nr:alpha/beta fold hydrolase [Rhodopila globiformis]PPQ36093.1 poly-beta-hydroxybutyrate polymerase [Rhodopila globiformis]